MKGGTLALERSLQTLFERNLEALLGIRFLASEQRTTNGQIDTLGIDENASPVIIEYKRASNENVINQGLFLTIPMRAEAVANSLGVGCRAGLRYPLLPSSSKV